MYAVQEIGEACRIGERGLEEGLSGIENSYALNCKKLVDFLGKDSGGLGVNSIYLDR
jgi:hypothetical protein